MPSDWIPNVGTQLERAIRALFVSRGDVTMGDCYISNDSRTRIELGSPQGITDIVAISSDATDLEPTGNEKWIVHLDNTFSTSADAAELNRVIMDTRVGRQKLAMMRGVDSLDETCADITTQGRALSVAVDSSDDAIQSATDNADMAEFTALFGRFIGSSRGNPNVDSSAWRERLIFEIVSCPTAID